MPAARAPLAVELLALLGDPGKARAGVRGEVEEAMELKESLVGLSEKQQQALLLEATLHQSMTKMEQFVYGRNVPEFGFEESPGERPMKPIAKWKRSAEAAVAHKFKAIGFEKPEPP